VAITKLNQYLSDLYKKRAPGIKLRLDAETAFLNTLGNPHHKFQAIHIAGTNGKGTVCGILHSILQQAGFKTGLYTSPHLVEFNERIKINNICISDKELLELLNDIDCLAGRFAKTNRQLTFFEFTTAAAFEYFKRQQIDIAIVETGMGGRLDATNVLNPLLSVITAVDIEHTQYLGKTIKEIAREKGGIIKRNIPVITGQLAEEALQIVTEIADANNSPIIKANDVLSVQRKQQNCRSQKIVMETTNRFIGTATLPVIGAKAAEDAAIAVAALEILEQLIGVEIPNNSIKNGLKNLNIQARCQLISDDPPILLDGAHNPQAAHWLAHTIKELFKRKPVGIIIGMCSDKNLKGFLKQLSKTASRCWAVGFDNERSLNPSEIAKTAEQLNIPAKKANLQQALNEAAKWAKENNGAVCITGSFILCGEVLKLYRSNQ
jgi:dihydrofolate synthase / folylpolyglutamate synthase